MSEDMYQWKNWQDAKAHAVKCGWENGDKKAYWDACLAEMRAECIYEIAKLEAQYAQQMETMNESLQRMQEKISEQQATIKLLLESATLLMRKADTK